MSATIEPRILQSQADRLRLHSRIAAVLVAGVALVALLGWALDVSVLRSVLPGHVQMKANTALGFVLAGLALGACGLGLGRMVSRLASLVVLALGAAVLAEYSTGVDSGLGTLLFPDPGALRAGKVPGQMSQLSASGFVLAGGIGLATSWRPGHWLGQALALVMLVGALFALSGYGYLMGADGAGVAINPVGLNTALCLLLLALGWLVANPQDGLASVLVANSLGGVLARRLLLPVLMAPVLLSYLAQVSRRSGLLSEGATITWLAVASGLAAAGLVWWSSRLLDSIERQRRVARQLRESALTDELTHLGNRRAFDESLAALQARGGGFSLLMLDLDHFKTYNDTHGHLAGDQALRNTGALLQAALRPGDVAARFGGEEFAVLLPHIDGARALLVAERICRDFHVADWPFERVTVSIGVAEVQPGESTIDLVARADAALYAAKAAGRDRAVLAPAQSASA